MRRWLPILLILFGGWGLLEALTWQAGLGKYAKSPQRLRLNLGLTSIVGGGRAGVVYLENHYRKRASFIVRCEDQQRQLKLRRQQISEETCGIRLQLLEILPEGKIEVEVRWGDDLFPQEMEETDDEPLQLQNDASPTEASPTEAQESGDATAAGTTPGS